jgi:hypothetical protein
MPRPDAYTVLRFLRRAENQRIFETELKSGRSYLKHRRLVLVAQYRSSANYLPSTLRLTSATCC